MRLHKLYTRFIFFYLIVIITGLLCFFFVFVPGVDREIAQLTASGTMSPALLSEQRDGMVRNGFLCFFLIGLSTVPIPIAFLLYCYLPLQNTVALSFICLGGTTQSPFRKTRTREFEELRENLIALGRESNNIIESQQTLLSNLTHDIRSPLTSIRGYTQAMLDGTIPEERRDHYLNVILTLSDRLTQMAEELTMLNKLHDRQISLTYSVFDMNVLASEIAQSVEILCKHKDLSLVLQLETPLPPVYADRVHIAQVLYNLLDNAIKFTPPHRTITLSTRVVYRLVHVTVSDQGIGIPKDQLPRIWERFYQVDHARTDDPGQGIHRGGSGLGLAIVKDIMQLHGQYISVHSTPGEGSTFTFSLDIANQ